MRPYGAIALHVLQARFSDVDRQLWGISISIEYAGEVLASKYFPTRGDADDSISIGRVARMYEIEFEARGEGEHTFTVEIKDEERGWMEKRKVSVTKPLAPPGPWPIFHDERYDPSKDGGGGGTTNPVDYEPSAAERRRGFPLEYTMASAGLYADDDGYVLGLDMIEVYDGETEVEVTFEKFNATDQPIDDNGETKPDFDARVGREIERQTKMMEAYEEFPVWFKRVWGARLGEKFEKAYEDNRRWRKENNIAEVTFDQYLEAWWTEDYRLSDDYQNIVGDVDVSYRDARNAGQKVQALRSQVWTQSFVTIPLHGLEIEQGVRLPEVVTKATATRWGGRITVKEGPRSEPKSVRLDEKPDASLFRKVDAAKREGQSALDRWREAYVVYQAEKDRAREAEQLRKLRTYEAIKGIGEAARLSREDAEGLFGMAVPGFGFFMSAGNTYMYAKEGDVQGAVVEGAAVLLDVLSMGFGRLLGKLGELVPFGPKGKQVAKLDANLVRKIVSEGAQSVAEVAERGIKAVKGLPEQLADAGVQARHATALKKFARSEQSMIVMRASNKNSLQWQGQAYEKGRYLPKPGNLSFKSHKEIGLVTGSKAPDGTLLDAAGKRTEFVVADDGRIFGQGQGGEDTLYVLRAGDARDSQGNLHSANFIEDANGNRFYSDYDLMGVYDESTVVPGKWIPRPTGDKTAPSPFIARINAAVDAALNLFQHGANDEHWKVLKGEVVLGNPNIGDKFVVFFENGAMEILDLADLEVLYRERIKSWPLD